MEETGSRKPSLSWPSLPNVSPKQCDHVMYLHAFSSLLSYHSSVPFALECGTVGH